MVAGYVLGTVALGLLIGRFLGVERVYSHLISGGTGICGGTTIATLAPIYRARAEVVGAALAIVFLLNAIALFTFPAVGEWLELSQQQFGVWAALAIHDTSSVIATAAIYGEEAAEVATTVKLGRTLWLIPAVVAVSLLEKRDQVKIKVPGFIFLSIAASVLGSVLPMPPVVPELASTLCQALLVIALFLVGAEIKRSTLKKLRGKMLWQALALWAMVAPVTLLAVMHLVA